ERRGGDRLAAAPAANEVQQPVEVAEALAERRRPGPRGVGIEEVDDARVEAIVGQVELGGEGVEPVLGDVGERQGGAVGGEAAGDRRPETAGGTGDREDAAVENTSRRLLRSRLEYL